MRLSLADALARLTVDPGVVCQYRIGSADFGDEAQWDKLGADFDEALRALTAVYGPPSVSCAFPARSSTRS